MRWPWVSRDAYEQAIWQRRSLEDHNLWLANGAEAADKRFDDLLARYHLLRLQGFAPETAPPVTVRPPSDPVLSAIARKAGRNTTLRQAMEAQAAKDRGEGIAESLILAQIERGRTPDEDEVFV